MSAFVQEVGGRIRPIGNKLLVRKDPVETMTKGGLLLPDMAQTHPERGTVLAVGPGKALESGERVPCAVKEGDRVLFFGMAGHWIDRHGDLAVMDEEEILGVED